MSSHVAGSWGPRLLGDGRAAFRVWAPAQNQVSLVAASSKRVLAMAPAGEGWFEIETDAVRVGEGYSFRLADGTDIPDPAARAQVDTVHGPSMLADPNAFTWQTPDWHGRLWEEAVVYEVHVGTFTPEGTFDAAITKLDGLVDLGVTAIELMPVAQFAGRRGWGYDGVLLYCPHNAYGGLDGLLRLVDAAHARGLMVILDVVYNHFGPDGNYLHLLAPEFFHPERHTPWGAAIAYEKRPVRDFFIENALYWLDAFRFDGLRLDAINQIEDQAQVPLLEELGQRIRTAFPDRPIHIMTEDDRNIIDLHPRDASGRPTLFTAEWNDDVHHVAHVIATGEAEGYYEDYTEPVPKLARALAEGFVYQGEPSPHWQGAPRGVASSQQPPVAFVDFLQNHDQVGNRAFGERLSVLAPVHRIVALTEVLLLSPHIPLLFMGEEWGEVRPFCFFTDFDGELAAAVREGRRAEFKTWSAFQDPARRAQIPDPNAIGTFTSCVLDWDAATRAPHSERRTLIRTLLHLRHAEIVPLLADIPGGAGRFNMLGRAAFDVSWQVGAAVLAMRANLADEPVALPEGPARGRLIYASASDLGDNTLAPWSVQVHIDGR